MESYFFRATLISSGTSLVHARDIVLSSLRNVLYFKREFEESLCIWLLTFVNLAFRSQGIWYLCPPTVFKLSKRVLSVSLRQLIEGSSLL